jgi:hypothetical protein
MVGFVLGQFLRRCLSRLFRLLPSPLQRSCLLCGRPHPVYDLPETGVVGEDVWRLLGSQQAKDRSSSGSNRVAAAASNTGRSDVTRMPVPLNIALGLCGDGKAGSTSGALSNTQPARTTVRDNLIRPVLPTLD